jgi:hypothetical protein
MPATFSLTSAAVAIALSAAWFAGCSAPPSAERSSFRAPPRQGFEPVSELLQARCGSLDCHGQPGRSLRIFGTNGLRLAADALPGLEGGVTEPAEHDANYASVVALEPEILDRVVRQGGRDPARLTLIRKARGAEEHTGGTASPTGGAGDVCLTSWLSQVTDVAACSAGATIERPSSR